MATKTKVSDVIKFDEFGPERMVTVYDPKLGMKGYVVIHNTALGLGKGGSRMTPTVTQDEVYRLAQGMTWKNSIAGLPWGGAKSGIVMPPELVGAKLPAKDLAKKKAFVESFARAIKPLIDGKQYVMGPDVNSGEREMDWFAAELKNKKASTGKSLKKGGLPHELGSTGFGVAHSAMVAMKLHGIDPKKATVAIEGYGNVGSFAHMFLSEWGVNVVGLADSRGATYKADGFDPKKVLALRKQRKSVSEYPKGKKLKRDAIFGMKVDVLIPATVTDVIHDGNKKSIKAKILVEGANIPMQESIEKELHKRGIFVVPDFVANSGGIISSYAEYMGYKPAKMFKMVESRVKKATKEVVERSLKTKKWPRQVAIEIAKERVAAKMKKRKSMF